MGKKKIQAYCFSLILLFICNASGSSSDITKCVLDVAKTQVGVQEATGKNDGPQVEAYLASVGLKKGNPYCAAYIAWCMKQCKVPKVGTAFSPSWFPQSKIIMQQQKNWESVIPGDVFGLYFKTHNRIAHVGIVEEVTKTHIITLEANTSPGQASGEADRNGDGVWRKRRMKKGIYAVSRWL